MNIADIFEVERGCLYSIRFEGEELDELRRCFDQWEDAEYLVNFFTHEDYGNKLRTYYRRVTEDPRGFNPETAMIRTFSDAEDLKARLYNAATLSGKKGTDDLGKLFEFLHTKKIGLHYPFYKVKLRGPKQASWLRIYAIKAAENLFFVCGGGIKITRTMQEHPRLQIEYDKMEAALTGLQEIFRQEIANGTFIGLQKK